MTVMIYSFVNLGTILRVFGDQTEFMVLGLQNYNVYRESSLGFTGKKYW